MHTDIKACGRTRSSADTVRESALKIDPGRKISCRAGESNLRQRCAGPTLYQLCYIPLYGSHFESLRGWRRDTKLSTEPPLQTAEAMLQKFLLLLIVSTVDCRQRCNHHQILLPGKRYVSKVCDKIMSHLKKLGNFPGITDKE